MRSIFVLFMSMVLVVSINAQDSAKTAVLVDSFERIQCEDGRSRMDNFMAELANSPSERGLIVVHPKAADPLWTFRQLQEFFAQARFRNFEMDKLDAKVGPARSTPLIELWRVPTGAAEPDAKPSHMGTDGVKYEVKKAVQFGTTNSSEESGCVSIPFDLETFALALKTLEGVRGRITVRGPNANRAHKKIKELIEEMRMYGVEAPAVRAAYSKGRKEVIELWIESATKTQ